MNKYTRRPLRDNVKSAPNASQNSPLEGAGVRSRAGSVAGCVDGIMLSRNAAIDQ